ncbi:MAG: DUF2442 domain-containing protein [Sulfuritalea sp.]|nr:DUF2442 domain-containing protein [Sulfuritalea sp.]
MIKVIKASYRGGFQVLLTFSDGAEGIFNGREFLRRNGPLLDALRDESFFRRVFIDAGALCWPNGLELSPTRLRETCVAPATA